MAAEHNQELGKHDTEYDGINHALTRTWKSYPKEPIDKATRFHGDGTVYLKGGFNSIQLKAIAWILENHPKFDETTAHIYPDD